MLFVCAVMFFVGHLVLRDMKIPEDQFSEQFDVDFDDEIDQLAGKIHGPSSVHDAEL